MKKILALALAAGIIASCTKTDEPVDPNIYGTWNITSIEYATEIDLGITKLPVTGTSMEPSSMTFNKDMTCSYDVVMKTEPDTILGQPLPGIEVPLKDSGTYTFTESEDKVTSVVITNSMSETLTFTVLMDQANSQQWKTISTYDTGPPISQQLDIELVMNMTK